MNSNDMQPGLRRLCRLVRAGAALGVPLALLLPLLLWTDRDWVAGVGSRMAGMSCMAVTVDDRAQWLGAAVSLLPALLGAAFFGVLWRLFGEYAAGRALTTGAQRHLQRLGWVLLAMVLVQVPLRTAYALVLTLGNPPGQRQLVLAVSSDDYVGAVVALALLAIATVMREAVRAAEENRGFV